MLNKVTNSGTKKIVKPVDILSDKKTLKFLFFKKA